jgi:hypothetical protein
MIEIICRHCGSPFSAGRADAAYCSVACRVAAHRQRRQVPPFTTQWLGRTARLSERDTGVGLTRAELGRKLCEIAGSEDGGAPKTGRRFYYLALSHGYIRPDMSATPEARKSRDAAYKRVTEILGILRKAGDLDWAAVLDLTRELDEWLIYASPREARENMRRFYDEDRWLGQPFYPVHVVEKDTMEPICRPLARRWQMPFSSSRGYGSLKLQHDVADMLRRRFARTGQRPLILFISDLDPSGLDLQRAWEDTLLDFGVGGAEFVRIGLDPGQVEAIDNPILRQGIEVKPSDSRAKRYIADYGDRCWETDILPAATIEEAIDAEINRRLDHDAWRRRDEEIERARRLL